MEMNDVNLRASQFRAQDEELADWYAQNGDIGGASTRMAVAQLKTGDADAVAKASKMCQITGCYIEDCQDDQKCHHGIALGGMGANVRVENVTFVSYEAAIYVGAWTINQRGGYESSLAGIEFVDVNRTATFFNEVAGLLRDLDGSLAALDRPDKSLGTSGGYIVPATLQLSRHPECQVRDDLWYAVCAVTVRRVVLSTKFKAPYWNLVKFSSFPYVGVHDITDHKARTFNRRTLFSLPTFQAMKGPHTCFALLGQ